MNNHEALDRQVQIGQNCNLYLNSSAKKQEIQNKQTMEEFCKEQESSEAIKNQAYVCQHYDELRSQGNIIMSQEFFNKAKKNNSYVTIYTEAIAMLDQAKANHKLYEEVNNKLNE